MNLKNWNIHSREEPTMSRGRHQDFVNFISLTIHGFVRDPFQIGKPNALTMSMPTDIFRYLGDLIDISPEWQFCGSDNTLNNEKAFIYTKHKQRNKVSFSPLIIWLLPAISSFKMNFFQSKVVEKMNRFCSQVWESRGLFRKNVRISECKKLFCAIKFRERTRPRDKSWPI
jgi:hypothetical protein